MAFGTRLDEHSSDADSDVGSGSDSESGSDSGRSDTSSGQEGGAPTPGREYNASDGEQQPSSPMSNQSGSPRSRSPSSSPRKSSPEGSRSASASPQKSATPESRSASGSPRKVDSRASSRSASGSPKQMSRSPSRSPEKSASRSVSPSSRKSASPTPSRSQSGSPRKSPTPDSVRSRSAESRRSGSQASVRSGTPQKSRSPESGVSRSSSYEKSKHSSPKSSVSGSQRSGSESPKRSVKSWRSSRSRSRSYSSKGSQRSGSASSNKSHTSEKSGKSHSDARSQSGSPVIAVNGKKEDAMSDDESSLVRRKRIHSQSEDSGSDSATAKSSPVKKKVVRALDSDSDLSVDGKPEDSATAEALFGDADDISSEDEGSKKGKGSEEDEKESGPERGRSDEEETDRRSEGEKEDREEEGDKEEEVTPETRIDVEIPRIMCDIGKELHFVKLPNFLSVETRPFSADTYEDEIDEEETLDEEGRARLKLKVENTMRWREALDKEGNTIKESNARIVRWSDGSMSLHLGGEIFDVYKQAVKVDHYHLFVRQGTGLQGQAVFRTKLTFRPHSTESFTHRKMTLSLADRSQKSSGIKVLSQVGHDPDQHRGEMIKKEEERLRATVRRESKTKRTRERGAGRPLSTSYLEPDREEGSDDDGAISLNAIKNRYNQKSDNRKQSIYSSDDEGSDLEARRPRRVDKSKALQDSEEEEEVENASQASDES